MTHNSLPSDLRTWTHYFYYHYFRWLSHLSGTTTPNLFSRYLPASSFSTWEEYWQYYATSFCAHMQRERSATDDAEDAKLLPKLLASKEEQQLHAWATWATSESLL